MSFLGPVTTLGGELVRPHDLHLHTSDPGHAWRGQVTRVTRVGFEVRVEVTIDRSPDDAAAPTVTPVLVTLTRAEFRVLDIDTDATVWVHPVDGAPTVTSSAVAVTV